MCIHNHRVLPIIGCVLSFAVFGAAQEPHQEHPWDYGEAHGPGHWGELKPEYAPCKDGHHQSPIDIRNPQKADLPPIKFDYQASPLDIIDNGHTIMINYAPGSSISIGGKQYVLKQFHFHRPSEEKIDGKNYAMTLHLVHQDAEGKLAVVAVLLESGKNNDLIEDLWSHLPAEEGKEQVFKDIRIDVSRLLPGNRGYYTFSGSLTTPPCTEDVTWYVLKEPVPVSDAEIARFSKLYRNDARPTQPLYDRVVMESK